MNYILPGLLFSILWASASVATKFGLQSAEPLVLATTRFLIAGGLMLIYAHLAQHKSARFPTKTEWKQLLIFGLLNTTIYLGAFVYAIREVSAGIGSLSTATNPLFILLFSALWLKRGIGKAEISGIILGILGVLLATYPLLLSSHATLRGLLILFFAMISVSLATVYYTSIKWTLSPLIINAWQVFLGGLVLLPLAWFSSEQRSWTPDTRFWLSVSWLIVPVSIIALQLWFYLVRRDAVKASLWLFLCPVFGFIYAAVLLREPITWYTWAGTLLVLAGLYIANRPRR